MLAGRIQSLYTQPSFTGTAEKITPFRPDYALAEATEEQES